MSLTLVSSEKDGPPSRNLELLNPHSTTDDTKTLASAREATTTSFRCLDEAGTISQFEDLSQAAYD